MSNNILDMIPYCVQLRAAFQEFSADAHDLLNQSRSVFPDIEMHTDKMTEALYVNTCDPEMDALTLIAIQLILSNHLILFEHQAEMYLPGGEHAEVGKDKEIMRNCSLTNRGCESNMGLLDREVRMRPNATPGYLSASVIVKSGGLAGINDVTDEKKGKVFDVARWYASDCIEENKKKLAMYIAGQKAVLRQRQQSKEDKEKRLVKSKSKIISDITKYGGEWKSRSDVEKYLGECGNDSEAVAAIECQLCYHRVILQAKKILPKDKHDLFVIKGNNLQKLKKNLITIIESSPQYESLADVDDDVVRVTGLTLLTSSERKQLYEERVATLKEKLCSAREKRTEKNTVKDTEKSTEKNTEKDTDDVPLRKKRKTKSGSEVNVPDPSFLVGKRVERTFMIKEKRKKCRKK